MIITIKDLFKMAGILAVAFCAVIVCAMFLNFNLDLLALKQRADFPVYEPVYKIMEMNGKVICGVSGGCLFLTSIVLLCFYIGHYIDTHKKELGILKALGYSRLQMAVGFSAFGGCVLAGTGLGYGASWLFLMPRFYEMQNKDGLLPEIRMHFHPWLFLALVAGPTAFFALLAIFYSYHKLGVPALSLLRGTSGTKAKKAKKVSCLPFLQELSRSNVRQRKSLVFFITFAVFCFSSMVQMSASMEALASAMMAAMIFCIGIFLAVVTLFLATTSVVRANGKTITMMKVFGYGARDCARAVLGGYRPWAYLGFALGTVYQYGLLKVMVEFVFQDMEGMPAYGFDFPAMAATLAAFVVLYETIMLAYARKMEKAPLKEIMLE